MEHGEVWRQEQVQHRDDETDTPGEQDADSGQSGDTGEYGYGGADDSSGSGDVGTGGDDAANSGYQAVCDDHNWHGPCQASYDAAYNDSLAHNNRLHGGEVGAAVFGPGACF